MSEEMQNSSADLPRVSIVMLAWNRRIDVLESLSRIHEITFDRFEVIVVDNASTDGTAACIALQFPKVKVLRMADNLGIEGYNAGFRAARGEFLLILDDDSFPERQAVTRMVAKFEQDPKLGVVAFDVRNFYSYDEVRKELPPPGEGMVPSSYHMSFNGAGAGVRRDLFERVGFYPGEFFLYQNELDSALRILDEGYSIQFFPDVVAYHKFSPINRASWRAPYFYTRNAFWLLWKHFPLDQVLVRSLWLLYRCFYHGMEQRTNVYLRAFWAALRESGALRGKRKPVDRALLNKVRIPWELNFTFYR